MRLLYVLALALLPLAAAQGDPSGVGIDPAQQTGRVSVEEAATFTFTVTHTGGMDAPAQERLVVVSAEVTGYGWTVQVSPVSFRLAPGDEERVTVQVAVATEGAGTAEVRVLAQMTRQVPEQLPVAPIVDPAAEDEATIALERADGVARDIIERLQPGVWLAVLLLAVVAALVLAIRLAMGRRATIRIDAPEAEQVVPAGSKARFRVLVENAGDDDETVIFHVVEPPAGWSAFLPVPELLLRRDHVEELQLVVVVPKDAPPGTRQRIEVVANASRSGRAARQGFEVVVR